MRSAELARLAGVSVRTLRHYHQVGLLAEPERGANGYRHYDVHDLIRVLRVRRLASLGIPLERMTGLLDDTDDDAPGLLDDLDDELAAQIERLSRQRTLIAHIRASGASPDLPPELAPFIALFGTGLPVHIARVDRDQTVLMAHLAGEEGMKHLTRFYERVSDPDLVPVVAAISERFASLGADDTEAQVEQFVDEFVAAFAPIVAEFATDPVTNGLGGAAALMDEYAADVLNEKQRYVIAQLEARLAT